MRWIYNILFTLAFWAVSPWLLIRLRRRGQWRAGFGQRFGRYAPGLVSTKAQGERRLWLHAVSVGEVNTCLQFLRQLKLKRPDWSLFVSTTTNTGMAELQSKLPPGVTPIYFPIDSRRYVCRALDAIQPDATILVEREIWPNFLWALDDRRIPLCLINARISENSFNAYSRYAFLFKPLYALFRLVTAQTKLDRDRLAGLGCRKEALHVLGSMKFDVDLQAPSAAVAATELLHRAGRSPTAKVLVAGSTHADEEVLMARAVQQLRQDFPQLFLVLVPRHFERCREVSEQLRTAGVAHTLRSSLKDPDSRAPSTNQCLLVDSTGELTAFYAEADLVFVGKSIMAKGGQNPIEPAALGKPLVYGRHMGNFPGVSQQLVSGKAAFQVSDENELTEAMALLLGSDALRAEMGHNASGIVEQNKGTTHRTVELVAETLEACWACQ